MIHVVYLSIILLLFLRCISLYIELSHIRIEKLERENLNKNTNFQNKSILNEPCKHNDDLVDLKDRRN